MSIVIIVVVMMVVIIIMVTIIIVIMIIIAFSNNIWNVVTGESADIAVDRCVEVEDVDVLVSTAVIIFFLAHFVVAVIVKGKVLCHGDAFTT